MDFATYIAAVNADQKALASGQALRGMDNCKECGTPLQEAITGNRELEDGTHVCSDCYFEAISQELDKHPIRALRISRR